MKKNNICNLKKLKTLKSIKEFLLSNIKKNILDVEIIYKSDFQYTKNLRLIISMFCDIYDFPLIDKSKLILVVDELNNNAIEHGSDNGDKNTMRIFFKRNKTNSLLNIEVEDTGKGKKHNTALDMETCRAHKLKRGYNKYHNIRGRGLFLITVNVVDRLYFKNTKDGGLIAGIKKEIKNKQNKKNKIKYL